MNNKNKSILEKYKNEIDKIFNKLNRLEKERLFEKTGAKRDGYLVVRSRF